VINW
jgi:hypothetical protein